MMGPQGPGRGSAGKKEKPAPKARRESKGKKEKRGEKGEKGDSGVVSEVDLGFFAMQIEDDGNLYIVTPDEQEPPAFSIDENGDLIYTVKETTA